MKYLIALAGLALIGFVVHAAADEARPVSTRDEGGNPSILSGFRPPLPPLPKGGKEWAFALLEVPAEGAEVVKQPASDVQDLLYLRGSRPHLLRLHVQVDGKPYTTVWEDFISAMFVFLDSDGDGFLDKQEAERALQPQMLLQIARSGVPFLIPANATLKFDDLKPTDGKVTRDQLAAYYRSKGLVAFQVQNDANASSQGEALSDILFKALDRNKDGKLSRAELQLAADSLRKFDTDDDETITISKLVPNGVIPGRQQIQPAMTPVNNTAFVAIDPTEPSAFVRRLLEAFDKDKNGTLSRAEIGLDQETFAKLDTNQDGELDSDELARFASLPPDGEFLVRLGKNGVVEVFKGADQPLAPSIKRAGDGLTLALGQTNLELRQAAAPAIAVVNTNQIILQQFRAAAGEKGFVEKSDLTGAARGLAGIFAIADRNGDGKLTEKELRETIALYDKAAKCFVALTIADQGRSLFDALDANRDGRLSFHELRSAWDQVAPWDKDGKGFITRDDIPGQLQLSFSHGSAPAGRGFILLGRNNPNTPAPVPTKGPLWFRKMDRNGDGVVSLREWLGSLEDFKRFDLNGDGVIDLDEAEKADAEMRKSSE